MAAFFYQRENGDLVQSDTYQTYNPEGFTYIGRWDVAPGPVVGSIATDGGPIEPLAAPAPVADPLPPDFAAPSFVQSGDPLLAPAPASDSGWLWLAGLVALFFLARKIK
jgi:hypothetical protein